MKSQDNYKKIKKKTTIKKSRTKIFEKFYSTGEIWVRGPVLRGNIRHGFWRYFLKTGQVLHCGNYHRGIFSGLWEEYNAINKKIRETLYIN